MPPKAFHACQSGISPTCFGRRALLRFHMQPAPGCAEKEILSSRYQADLRAYEIARDLLTGALDVSGDFYRRTERKRESCEIALQKLQAHQARHRC
jgi:hypothetical protein